MSQTLAWNGTDVTLTLPDAIESLLDEEIAGTDYEPLDSEYVFPSGDYSSATSLTIVANGLTTVMAAFPGWSSATSLSLPVNGVLGLISNGSFFGWAAAKSLVIPDSVTHINDTTFYEWSKATSLTLGRNVAHIAGWAFYGWKALATLTVLATTPPTLAENAGRWPFVDLSSACVIYVPSGALEAYQTAKYWSTYASQMQELSAETSDSPFWTNITGCYEYLS